MSVYDFKVNAMDGTEVSLSDYQGKVLLIVNTATGCGFTPQYAGLQELYQKYKDKGLEILDFPCNQFLGQAPGTNLEIHTFCTGRFGVTFKQFAKIDVNGKNEIPLYKYLKSQKHGFFSSRIKWNFTKFLIGKDGEVKGRYAPNMTPQALEKLIVKELES